MKNVLLLAGLVAVCLTGCGRPWIVIRQGPAVNPAMPLAVVPVTYDGLMVGRKSEAEYVGGKTDEQRASWEGDKNAFAGQFIASAMQHAAPFNIAGPDAAGGRGLIIAHVTFVEPGNFNGFVNFDTEVRTRVTITDPGQQPLDEIELRCRVGASMYRASVSLRMSDCGAATGRYLDRYLRERAGVR